MSIQNHQTSTRLPNLLDLVGATYVSATASGLAPSTSDDADATGVPSVDAAVLGPSVGVDTAKGPSIHVAGFWPSVGDDGVGE